MPRADLESYRDALLDRFSNPALKHRTWQIAMDGSQKLPQRLLGTIRDRLAAGQPFSRLALGVAVVVVKLGRDGCYVSQHDCADRIAGIPVDAVDATPLVGPVKVNPVVAAGCATAPTSPPAR